MKLLSKGRATLAALVAGGVLALFAPPVRATDIAGTAHITDDAGMFSTDAKRQADTRMSSAKFDRGLHFSVDTHKSAPPEWKSKYDAAGDKPHVVIDWAKARATGDREKGPFVLIVRQMSGKASGHTVVLIDSESKNRGFGKADEDAIRGIFDTAMRESAGKPADEAMRIRDAALLKATDYVINDMKGTKVTVTKDGAPLTTKSEAKKTAMGIGGWICLGLVVLLAIWLVVGIIRALTSPAYYGGGPGYGGPGYGGGGGFGFGTALLGGMFGAMAGMYLYNSMMGTHYPPQAFGGEATAADASTGGDTGAGDYDGGSSSATDGADYGGDDGGGGGGDYGGGGGDYGGGGGDYGGGGGDYGGGGGDYGGGGDFGGGDYGGGGDF